MTAEREGRGPRREKSDPALRFEKGADKEATEPKGRPAGAWKRPAARIAAESTVQPKAEPVAPGDPGRPAGAPAPEQAGVAYDPTGPGPPAADDPPEQPVNDTGPATSENGAPTKSADFVGRGGATERGDFGTLCPEAAERSSRRRVPKFRQHSHRAASAPGAPSGKFRQDSKQAPPADKLHHDNGPGPRPSGGGKAGPDPGPAAPEPEKLRKARERMEQKEGKLNTAKDKLARQKPVKRPGPVRQAAGWAGWRVHGFVHGKVYEVEHENVGAEGAHRSELVAEAAGRKAVRFTKQRIRTHPARVVKRAEGKSAKAAADYHFRQTVLEHPEMERKNVVARIWRKRQQRKRYQRQAREAAKQGARAAEATATATEKASRAVAGFVRRHPAGVVIALLCVLLLVVMQSCTSSLVTVGNGLTGSVTATTYPAEDADLLGAEAAYAALEADLQSRLDNYEATHSYDEYHFDLDDIEHDPYVLLSALSALHPDGWTLADVESTLQALFDRQYILTETVTTETRYRTETRTGADGDYEVEVPYTYYICTVTLENFDLSHVPVYIMGEEQLSRYALYMAALGNRPDLFPGSAYVGRYDGPVTRYEIPPEALEDEQFAAMIAEAEKYLGYPYVWGGASPATSFDCSGFVSWVVNHCGVGWNFGRLGAQGLYNVCTPVSSANARPGDLVFFRYTYNAPDPDGVTHCGIYVGDGMMIHCGDPISYANLNSSYWQSHFYAYGRLP